MPWDPDVDGPFGAWLRGGAPLGEGRTADVVVGDRTWVTRDQVVEGRTEDGTRWQRRRDQLGNDVIRETARGRERQHVNINLP
ncbi:hypothetical protein OG884_05735 [Streptosporangium sp. NBC_01755]|uniref:hypothetical protein n=1 Tax=unclassified Streptosporangium TaxID=2632669 RepID=UPI002DD983B4|nr:MULTISPECIES: hypothetical protein [unclassified Streptosporangium]WSA23672.1 hypothetical protein OIE13_22285 [Streptosporangium sp. NBC_01810]WSD01426.1 hypothetical protein OG884_05735 [Streptosporangium sp. NBC_01755]